MNARMTVHPGMRPLGWMVYIVPLLMTGLLSAANGKRKTGLDDYPFRNTSLPWDERVNDLVQRLTLEEMVLQMAYGGSGAGPCPAIERLGIPPYNFDTECLRGVVSPSKSTAFPQAIGLAATFSTETIFTMAEVISTEARGIYHDASARGDFDQQKSISCLAPFINIMRHPLWGRVQEIYGEDPFLTGTLTRAYVTGLQGSHPRYFRANAGCKTLVAHSGPDNIPASRFSFNAVVSERDLRVTYLPHLKMCVEAGSMNLMCSYNSINGVPACGNKRMMNDIIRKEYGFKGYIISDWNAIEFMYTAHGYVGSLLEAAALSANSGVDLELPADKNPSYFLLYDAVLKGMVNYTTIMTSVQRLFYTRMRLGLFDPPEMNPYSTIDSSVIQSDAHRKLALIAATKTFVLLKNNKILPIKMGSIQNLAIVGPMADNLAQLFGGYSPAIDTRYSSTPYEGLKLSAKSTVLAKGCDSNACGKYNGEEIKNATLAADLVIVCLGTGQQMESEGNDRSSLKLPGYQDQLLEDVISSTKKPIVLLIFSAGPLDINMANSSASVGAIMQCFFPAQSTGEALQMVLFETNGQVVSPAGRLPYTWPLSLDQVPPMVNYSMEGRTYRYFKGPGYPLYPFGYGLSYSQFKYSDLVVTPVEVKPGDNITVTVNVYNLGPYNSDEVTQVYISWRDIPVVMPQRQLVAISRYMTNIGPNPYAVTMTFKSEQLMIWDDVKGFIFHPGKIDVFVGGQQPDQPLSVGSNVLQSAIQIII